MLTCQCWNKDDLQGWTQSATVGMKIRLSKPEVEHITETGPNSVQSPAVYVVIKLPSDVIAGKKTLNVHDVFCGRSCLHCACPGAHGQGVEIGQARPGPIKTLQPVFLFLIAKFGSKLGNLSGRLRGAGLCAETSSQVWGAAYTRGCIGWWG